MIERFTVSTYRWLAQRIVPEIRATQYKYYELLRELLQADHDWLDLGCGHQILPAWVNADEPGLVRNCRSVVGLDLDFPSLLKNRIFAGRVAMGNLEHLPVKPRSFDLVTANMVVEHLEHPTAVLREIHAALRPGGRFLFHTPNRNAPALRVAAHTPDSIKKPIIRVLEKRVAEDVFPTHYQMNRVEDIHALAAAQGFQVERLDQISSTAVTFLLGPLALPELLFLRALESEQYKHLRSNFLVVLRKPA